MQDVVVGVDGSPGADAALRWAAAEARLWHARLHIVYCYPVVPETGVWLLEDEHAAGRALEVVTARSREQLTGLDWDARTEWAPTGSWGYKLVEVSRAADLLVVGSRGLGGFLQLLLGSVSHHVSIHSEASVIVVKDGAAPVVEPGGVVVGVDGSAPSLRALEWGAVEAARRGSALRAVHAYSVPSAHVRAARGISVAEAAQAQQRARALAADALAAAVTRARLPADQPVQQEVVAGTPAGVLVSVTRPDELLVCGPRGRGPVGQRMLGSVSDQCLRHAQAAVALPRSPLHDRT